MFDQMTVAFIGSGTMAEAILKAVLEQGLVVAEQVIASDVREERGRELAARYGVRTTTDNDLAVQQADLVVLAIKPQVLPHVLPEIEGRFRDGQVIFSIIAGVTIETLSQGTGLSAIVRVMPNTPAQVGAGMSVWTATATVTPAQRAQAEAILEALGEQVYVADERYLDMATAINGSGPAYVFLIMEAMVDAAVQLGFARPVAQKLVTQTMLGSVIFAQQSDRHLAELRNMVTSPGGTTAEALFEMEASGLRTALARGIMACYHKAVALGKK